MSDFNDVNYIIEIREFAMALRKIDSTRPTAEALETVLSFFHGLWRTSNRIYTQRGISIPIPKPRGLQPRGCIVEYSEINFNFKLGESFELDKIPELSEFQVKVEGYLETENDFITLQDHWRVDSHCFPPEPMPKEPHPYIHFQRGGHAQDEFAAQIGYTPNDKLELKTPCYALMQTPGPRIPFLPHCPILAIDFVIGQHDGDLWKRLRAIPDYHSVIKRSQNRLWRPFFRCSIISE
ncbi:hypothetical protein ACGK9R_02970 [Halomonas sp. HNIBRBA4712]|uniref:hypothetical protein n=1 Tax=Halomonas sp. HNIBRBA4712 TaxID=3373087 RepID=UPI00374571A2